MRISVVIPNYNYAAYLPVAIDSLLAQTDAVDEIIVVDDGSTDNSREVLNGYGNKIIAIFQDNAGQAAAISHGFSKATGDILCLLDSDDVFFSDKARLLRMIYRQNPEAGWVFHDLRHFGPDEARAPATYPRFRDLAKARKIDMRRLMRFGRLWYDAPATSGLTFRRDFIAPLFPLPAARSIHISDHYIKFFALASGAGLHIEEELGGQIIHGANLYTGAKADATRALIFVNTAFYLYQKLPRIKTFCTNLIAEGLACAKKAEISDQVAAIAGQYIRNLSRFELLVLKLKIAAKLIARNIH